MDMLSLANAASICDAARIEDTVNADIPVWPSAITGNSVGLRAHREIGTRPPDRDMPF